MPKYRGKTVSKYLAELFKLYNGHCVFCGDQVMMVRIAQEMGYSYDHRIIYKPDGLIKIATTEHVIRKADGGPNTIGDNLKLACADCNKERNLLFNKPKGEYTCRKCGTLFKSKEKRRSCSVCRRNQIYNNPYFLIMMSHA